MNICKLNIFVRKKWQMWRNYIMHRYFVSTFSFCKVNENTYWLDLYEIWINYGYNLSQPIFSQAFNFFFYNWWFPPTCQKIFTNTSSVQLLFQSKHFCEKHVCIDIWFMTISTVSIIVTIVRNKIITEHNRWSNFMNFTIY